MTRRAIRVFWGRRPESVQAVASRWRRTLEQVEFLLPEVVGGSWQQIHSAGPATAVTVDQLAWKSFPNSNMESSMSMLGLQPQLL